MQNKLRRGQEEYINSATGGYRNEWMANKDLYYKLKEPERTASIKMPTSNDVYERINALLDTDKLRHKYTTYGINHSPLNETCISRPTFYNTTLVHLLDKLLPSMLGNIKYTTVTVMRGINGEVIRPGRVMGKTWLCYTGENVNATITMEGKKLTSANCHRRWISADNKCRITASDCGNGQLIMITCWTGVDASTEMERKVLNGIGFPLPNRPEINCIMGSDTGKQYLHRHIDLGGVYRVQEDPDSGTFMSKLLGQTRKEKDRTMIQDQYGELHSRWDAPWDWGVDDDYDEDLYFGNVNEVESIPSNIQRALEKCVRKVKSKELSWKEVINCKFDPGFRKAIGKELQSFIDNGVYQVVPRPEGHLNTVPFRMICTYKHEDPSDPRKITRSKARLIYKGFKDWGLQEGLHTSSPTVNMGAVRALIQIAVQYWWRLSTIDISTAFLRGGDLVGEVYSGIPPGLEEHLDVPDGHVLQLKKGVYGLADWPRLWYKTLDSYLVGELKLYRSRIDPSLYIHYEKIASETTTDEFNKAVKMKELSALGLISRSLISYIDLEFYRNHKLAGFIGVYVDDCIYAGTKDFHNTIIKRLLNKYNIEAASEPPFKFLGGTLSYDGDDALIDYNGHFTKLELLEIPSDINSDNWRWQRVDQRVHLKYRQWIGVLNYAIQQGYPLWAYEVS